MINIHNNRDLRFKMLGIKRVLKDKIGTILCKCQTSESKSAEKVIMDHVESTCEDLYTFRCRYLYALASISQAIIVNNT